MTELAGPIHQWDLASTALATGSEHSAGDSRCRARLAAERGSSPRSRRRCPSPASRCRHLLARYLEPGLHDQVSWHRSRPGLPECEDVPVDAPDIRAPELGHGAKRTTVKPAEENLVTGHCVRTGAVQLIRGNSRIATDQS